jgi:hypothetical protein
MPTEPLPGEDDAGAPLDPDAIELRYRYHRARRNARIRQKQESRLARYRFYIVMLVLIALALGFVLARDPAAVRPVATALTAGA